MEYASDGTYIAATVTVDRMYVLQKELAKALVRESTNERYRLSWLQKDVAITVDCVRMGFHG